jgi:hypothetical protein
LREDFIVTTLAWFYCVDQSICGNWWVNVGYAGLLLSKGLLRIRDVGN